MCVLIIDMAVCVRACMRACVCVHACALSSDMRILRPGLLLTRG